MNAHAIAYLIGAVLMAIGLANGDFLHFGEGGLVLDGMAAFLTKAGAVVCIGAWCLELIFMARKL